MLQLIHHALAGVIEIVTPRFEDDRGFFSETWNQKTWAHAGLDLGFVQDNHSVSKYPGTVRGLHFQTSPHAQGKLVRVVRGAVFDVAVDIRRNSASFGQWLGVELSESKWNQLYIPAGFAHGFMTLEPDSHVTYKVTAPYSRDHDRAIRFDDPAIGIAWPLDAAAAVLSDKDRAAPLLRDCDIGIFD
jgi:dTDP-4-dehydrorhamnose 3,5-epimerase